MFNASGISDTVICMLNEKVRNHKHLRRCKAIVSFEEPFLTASTTLQLLYKNSVLLFVSIYPASYIITQYNWYQLFCHYAKWGQICWPRKLKPTTIKVCSAHPRTRHIILYLKVLCDLILEN